MTQPRLHISLTTPQKHACRAIAEQYALPPYTGTMDLSTGPPASLRRLALDLTAGLEDVNLSEAERISGVLLVGLVSQGVISEVTARRIAQEWLSAFRPIACPPGTWEE